MQGLSLYKLKKEIQLDPLRDYFAAFFGPLVVVLTTFLIKKIFEYFNSYVSINEIDMVVYLWLHNINLFFVLSFGGVIFLRVLSSVRKYAKIPWDLVTPPFEVSTGNSKPKINSRIVNRAKISSGAGFIIGIYSTLLLQAIGFVPYRKGMVLTGPLGKPAPNVTVPGFISELPILSDLIVLGDFVASPHAFGYILVAITISPIIVGFWNLVYLFFNHRRFQKNIPDRETRTAILFRWIPYVGSLGHLIVTWEFGVFWFFQ